MLFVRDFLLDQQLFRRADAPAAPAVSVILPTFQRCAGGSLRRALDSVLSQSFADLELIVVDDGSVDGTRELVQGLQREDARVVHLRHERNCGLPALRVNEGIEIARGGLIAFQFDDDVWLPGGLAALVAAALAAPVPGLVFGRADWVAATWRTELPRVKVDLASLTEQNEIANNAVLVPRRLLALSGLYDPHVGMRRLCDWDLWLRLLAYAPLVPVDRLVSRVACDADSTAIGVTAPIHLPLARYLQSIPRDRFLSFGRWRDYQVDGLRVAGVGVPGALGERLEREHLAPFRARLRHAPPDASAGRGDAPAPPCVLLITSDVYDDSLELCFGSYDALDCRRGGYKQVYHPVRQLDCEARQDAGLLLFSQTVSPIAVGTVSEIAVAGGPPVAYHLGDGLVPRYGDASALGILAPEHPARNEIDRQLAGVDAVWSANPEWNEAVRPLNPRVVPHPCAVPERWLPEELPPRGSSGRLHLGGVGCTRKELRLLSAALQAVGERWSDGLLEWELWEAEVAGLAPLASPIARRPIPGGFRRFIARLRHGRFDLLLVPFLDVPRARVAQAPTEYSLAAVAGALGIFSDVAPCAPLPHGVACLKPENTPDAWAAAIEAALTMPAERFDAIRQAMLEHVRRECTAEARIHLHEAACRATALHAATRQQRIDGRPRVLYLFASGAPRDLHDELLRAAELAQEYGLAPRALCARNAFELQRRLVDRGLPWKALPPELLDAAASRAEVAPLRGPLCAERPARVHASSPMPQAAALCAELEIPAVVTPPRWTGDPRSRRLASELLGLYETATGGAAAAGGRGR